MSYCRKCGTELVPADQFCRACGAPAEQAPRTVQPAVPPDTPRRRKGRRMALAVLACVIVLLAASTIVGYLVWTDASVDPAAVETIVLD